MFEIIYSCTAIQFVLANEFFHLPKVQRESMLHSSGGSHASSAFVEIIFDNKDRRIPVRYTAINLMIKFLTSIFQLCPRMVVMKSD